jgi:hypothetical protein
VIRIRYLDPNELSPGLHAAAEQHGRSTIVYLISGLTAAERRAALRRLRLSARMGCSPELPVPQLALALLADRIKTATGRTGAVFRLHPAGSTVPVMMVSAGAIAFLALSAVSIRVLHPHLPGQAAPGTPPAVSASQPGEPPQDGATGDPVDPGGPGSWLLSASPSPGSTVGALPGGDLGPSGVPSPTPSAGTDPALSSGQTGSAADDPDPHSSPANIDSGSEPSPDIGSQATPNATASASPTPTPTDTATPSPDPDSSSSDLSDGAMAAVTPAQGGGV